MSTRIHCPNRSFTGSSDDQLTLQSYSALSEIQKLLYIATPDGYSSALCSYTYSTDRKGAQTAAGWLNSACEEMANGVSSIGFMLSTLDENASPGEMRGVGSVLMLIGGLMQAASDGSDNLKFYARQLEAAGLDSPPESAEPDPRP